MRSFFVVVVVVKTQSIASPGAIFVRLYCECTHDIIARLLSLFATRAGHPAPHRATVNEIKTIKLRAPLVNLSLPRAPARATPERRVVREQNITFGRNRRRRRTRYTGTMVVPKSCHTRQQQQQTPILYVIDSLSGKRSLYGRTQRRRTSHVGGGPLSEAEVKSRPIVRNRFGQSSREGNVAVVAGD